MLNNVVLIGRINNDIEKMENEEKTSYRLVLKISRNFKNQNGEYENDYVPIELTGCIGNHTFEYCKKGDIIGNNVIWYTQRAKNNKSLYL